MALRLKMSQTIEEAEAIKSAQEATEDAIRRDELVREEIAEHDQELAQTLADEDDLSIEEAEQLQTKLEAELAEKREENAYYDSESEKLHRLDLVMKEGERITALQHELAQKELAKIDDAEKQLRLQRELTNNMNPTPFKDLEANRELIATVRQQENKTLSPQERKQLREDAKTALVEVDTRIVDFQHGNFAGTIEAGATKVMTKEVGNVLKRADKASAFAIMGQMRARQSRIESIHNERVSELQNKIAEARKFDNEEQAAYYEKRIAYEEKCYERDIAQEVLAKYEFIDGRSDSDRCVEQRKDIEALRAEADQMHAELMAMKEYQIALEEPRVVEVSDIDTEAANAELDKAFDDIDYAMEKDEQAKQDQMYEEDTAADADESSDSDDDPYLAEFRAEKALEEQIQAHEDDRDIVDEDDYLEIESRAEKALEEHFQKLESDDQDDEIDPENLQDTDERTPESFETDEEDVNNLMYDMHGRLVQDSERGSQIEDLVDAVEEVDADAENVEPDQIEELDASYDVEMVDIEEPEIESEEPEVETAEFEEPEIELDVDLLNLIDVEAPEVQETEAEADAENDTEQPVTASEQAQEIVAEQDHVEVDEADQAVEAPAPEADQPEMVAEIIDVNRNGQSEANAVDDKITAEFLAKSKNASHEYEQATESGDIDAILDAEDKMMSVNQEFDSYMNDRKAFDTQMQSVREAAADYAKAETDTQKATAATKYAEAYDSAQTTVAKVKASDKSYADTMERQLHSEVSDQMAVLRKSEPEGEKFGLETAIAKKQSDTSTIRITMKDLEETKAMMAHTQSQMAQHSQTSSSSASS
nr:hypothetical protein [Brucella intermedia]